MRNLDGQEKGGNSGSENWRYFLTEEPSDPNMPRASIELLYEMIFACTEFIRHEGNPVGAERRSYLRWLGHKCEDKYIRRFEPERVPPEQDKYRNRIVTFSDTADKHGQHHFIIVKNRTIHSGRFGYPPDDPETPAIEAPPDILMEALLDPPRY